MKAVVLMMTLTFYDADAACTGKSPGHPAHGITKSGVKARPGVTVACDPTVLPLGTVVHIEGRGWRECQDTGGAIKGARIDEYVRSHREALRLGKRTVKVRVAPQS